MWGLAYSIFNIKETLNKNFIKIIESTKTKDEQNINKR